MNPLGITHRCRQEWQTLSEMMSVSKAVTESTITWRPSQGLYFTFLDNFWMTSTLLSRQGLFNKCLRKSGSKGLQSKCFWNLTLATAYIYEGQGFSKTTGHRLLICVHCLIKSEYSLPVLQFQFGLQMVINQCLVAKNRHRWQLCTFGRDDFDCLDTY